MFTEGIYGVLLVVFLISSKELMEVVIFLPRYLKLFQAVLSWAETSLTYSKMFGILSDRLG